MKKLILWISFLALMVGASWYAQDALRGYLAPADGGLSAEEPRPSIDDKPIVEAPPKSEREIFQERALAIANRPTYINVNLSPAMEKLARDKIANAVNMIVDNFDYDVPWLELGGYRKIIGDYEGALQAWLFLSEIRPNSFVSFHNIGDLYAFTLKNYQKGEQYLLASLELNEGSTQGYLALANLYQNVPELGKADRVDDILLRGLKVDAVNPLLLTTLAGYYRDSGSRDLALAYFKKALTVLPGNESIRQEIAALEK
jgi:tetratricopeptide (TPR) repeat protein